MPRIKIYKVYSNGCNYCYNSFESVVGEITEWEDIYGEDLDILKEHIAEYNRFNNGYNYVLIEDLPNNEYKFAVSSVLEFAKKKKLENEKRLKKIADSNAKRQKTKRKNQEEKERKLLAELQSKYSD